MRQYRPEESADRSADEQADEQSEVGVAQRPEGDRHLRIDAHQGGDRQDHDLQPVAEAGRADHDAPENLTAPEQQRGHGPGVGNQRHQ